jgi:hypothetical protein
MHELLSAWLAQEKRGWITNEPKGFRDIMWCPYLNEPAILEYKEGKPWCPNCENFEAETHEFIGHIKKYNECA